MIPISLIWDPRGRIYVGPIALLVMKEKDGEVSIFALRRMPAMVEALLGKFLNKVEKNADMIRGRKEGETTEPKG